MSERELRRLWQLEQGRRQAIAPDQRLAALHGGSAAENESAVASVAEQPLAAVLARVSVSLRGDAEQLAREVHRLRRPRAMPVRRRHAGWAVAASVVLAAWAFWPQRVADPVLPGAPLASQEASDAARILVGSFESAPAEPAASSSQVFTAGFDS